MCVGKNMCAAQLVFFELIVCERMGEFTLSTCCLFAVKLSASTKRVCLKTRVMFFLVSGKIQAFHRV